MINKKNFNTYIKENNTDILIYCCLFIVITLLLLFVGYKIHCYYILLFDIFFLNSVALRIEVKLNLKKIYTYLINHNLIDEVGTIEYWNERNYFLTEKYIIILYNGKVKMISYLDIVSIEKDKKMRWKQYSYYEEYLIITLSNNETYKILSYTTILTNEKYKDLSYFLLAKNSNIVKK